MSSIFAGSFFTNGPFTSRLEISYCVITGSSLVFESFVHISGVSGWSDATPLASANAFSALSAFSPDLPSISPGENRARSSRTCAFARAGSILSLLTGLERNSALLIAAAPRLAADAAMMSQPKTMLAANRRTIRQSPAHAGNNEFKAERFPARERPGARHLLISLVRALHGRLFGVFHGGAE